MIAWSSKHIALVVGLFLASFLGAFAIITLCELEVIEHISSTSDTSKKANRSIHGLHNEQEFDFHEIANSDHSESSTDECCDDTAIDLEMALFSETIENALPDAKYFLEQSIIFSYQIGFEHGCIRSIYHEYDGPPPLTGISLRVAIQSFLT